MRAYRLVWLVLLTIAACDSGTTEPPTIGRFDAEVRGSLDRQLSGDAGFIVTTGGEETRLFVSLSERSVTGRSIGISGPGTALLTVGTYALNDLEGPFIGLTYSDAPRDVERFYMATGGTLRVTRATPDRIEGTVTADLAAGLQRESSAQLTADFEAALVPPPQD